MNTQDAKRDLYNALRPKVETTLWPYGNVPHASTEEYYRMECHLLDFCAAIVEGREGKVD